MTTTMEWRLHSYPKIHNIRHRLAEPLLTGDVDVIVEEKFDGSQFSFGVHPDTAELHMRSKRVELRWGGGQATKIFHKAMSRAIELKEQLTPGWIYRGEAFRGRRHNHLGYETEPPGGIVLFDVDIGYEHYMNRQDMEQEAERLELLAAPILYQGKLANAEKIAEMLDTRSALGAEVTIEGVVVKPAAAPLFDPEGKRVMAKMVRADFAEKQKADAEWKHQNPTPKEAVDILARRYAAEPRWRKALQTLRDEGSLTWTPKDIGPVLDYLKKDLEEECAEEIKEQLWRIHKDTILTKATRGFPEWYKKELER